VEKPEGTGASILAFTSTWKLVRNNRLPSSSGIVPLSLFFDKINAVKLAKRLNSVGTVEVSALLLKYKEVNLVKSPNEEGTTPVRPASVKVISLRSGSSIATFTGNMDSRESIYFWEKIITSRLESSDVSGGN
jgi:hypothetical protein